MNKLGKVVLSAVVAGSVLFGGGINSEAANKKSSDDGLVINKATNQLVHYQDGKRVAAYKVATGKDNKSNKTPEGTFKINKKIKNRPYYKGGIPGGSPKNPLGPRWMELNIPGGAYAIHGNNNPKSIGTYASAGCVRMDNPKIIALYDKVLIGTKVKIYNNKNTSHDTVARQMGILKTTVKKAAVKESHVKAKVVKWSGSKVTIQYSGKTKVLSTSNKWYQKNLKKGKTYNFYFKGSAITKVNA